MATHSPSYLALKINALLDGQPFYDHWHEKFRNAQTYGASIKSLCPFHLGESFRSFLLDLRKKTFCCTVTQCKAAAGGTFAELHGLLIDKPLLDALLDLCSTFKLALPDDVRLLFAATLADHARELLREGKPEAAEGVAIQGFKKDSTSAALQLLLAEICEARDRPADARPYYDTVLREAIAEENWDQAAAVFDRLRSMEADQGAYAEQAAAIAQARGDRAQAVAAYLDLASRPGTPPERQRLWLEQARSLDPACPEVLEQLGALVEQTGPPDEAVAIWKVLAECHRQAGRPQQSLEVLDRLVRLHPEFHDLDEQRADLMLEANRPDDAARLFRSLADRALDQRALDRAEHYLRRLCDAFPRDIEAHWLLLILFEQTDREDNAALIADHLLAVGDVETMGERYIEILKRLRQWRPNNILYRERLASHSASQGDVETALNEMRDLVERCFLRGATAEALQRIQTMRSMAADHPARRREIAQLLTTHGCSAEAVSEYESIARQSAGSVASLAEEACLRGLELDASRPVLHEILLQISLTRHPARAFEQCHWLVEFYRTRGDVLKAIALLEQLAPHLPEEIEPRLWLAGLAIESGQADRALATLAEIVPLELSADQTAKALEIANALVPHYSQSIRLLQLLAALHRRQADQEVLIATLLQLAAAQQGAGLLAEAEAAYAEVLAIRPNETRALHGQAEAVRERQGFAAAKPIYQRYGERLVAEGRSEEALRVYLQCIAWASEDRDFRRAAAALFAEQGDLNQARAQWEIAAALSLAVHNDPTAAAACWQSILNDCPDDPEASRNLARLHVLRGETNAAKQALDRIGEPLPDAALASHEMLLKASLTLNHPIEAFEHASILSGLYEAQKRPEAALAMARKMVELQPQEPSAYARLAEVLEHQGARDELCQALETLADLHTRAGNLQNAAETLDRYLAIRPDSTAVRKRYISLAAKIGPSTHLVESCEAVIAAAVKAGDTDEAVRLFEQAVEMNPDNTGLRERRIRFLYEQKRDEQGHRAVLELANYLAQSDNLKKAIELLSKTIKQRPDVGEWHARLGDFLLAQNAKGRAIVSLRKAMQLFAEKGDRVATQALAEKILIVDPLDVATRAALVELLLAERQTSPALAHSRMLAAHYVDRDLFDLAEHEYRRIVSLEPDDLASWQNIIEMIERMNVQREHVSDYLLVADLFVRRGLLDEAIHFYHKTVQLDPDNIEVRRALIETHIQIGDERGVVSDYLDLAELLSMQGQMEDAFKIYCRVLELEPNHPVATYHTNRLKSFVSRHVSSHGAPASSSSSVISTVPGSEKSLREMLENYRTILKTKPENPMIRARLGAVLFQLGETEEALKEWDLASAGLFQSGDYKAVIRVCEKMLQVDPNRPNIQERLAQAKVKKDSMTAIESAIESVEHGPRTA